MELPTPSDEWHVDVEMPTPLLRKVVAITNVRERSNDDTSLFRVTHEAQGQIFPGDSKRTQVSYRMDSVLFGRKSDLFAQAIIARAYVEGSLMAEVTKPVSEMQCCSKRRDELCGHPSVL